MNIFMYIKEHIFYNKWYINPGLSVIKLLKIRLYNRPRVANTRRLMLIMVPGCGRSPQEAETKYQYCIYTYAYFNVNGGFSGWNNS